MADSIYNTHLLSVPKGMRLSLGTVATVELPECMGRDVWLSIKRDRLIAASGQSNVVVLLTSPSEMPDVPADCA